jgi:hypothetical protein
MSVDWTFTTPSDLRSATGRAHKEGGWYDVAPRELCLILDANVCVKWTIVVRSSVLQHLAYSENPSFPLCKLATVTSLSASVETFRLDTPSETSVTVSEMFSCAYREFPRSEV